jgi:serine/threonine protein kinase
MTDGHASEDTSGDHASAEHQWETDAAKPGPLVWKQFSVCGSRFTLPDYYEVIKGIGQGAYGTVCSATNLRTKSNVAVKKISNAFSHAVEVSPAWPRVRTPACCC